MLYRPVEPAINRLAVDIDGSGPCQAQNTICSAVGIQECSGRLY